MSFMQDLKSGVLTDNPVFMQTIGLCPTLATTTSLSNAIGMGVAATVVLVASNIVISALRKFIPDKVRIAAFITIIAAFVTIIDLSLQAFIPSLAASLGLFLPLIVVNCIILGRAEAYASKNKVLPSAVDGIVMGLGFTFAITLLSCIREALGSGTIFGFQVMPANYQPMGIMLNVPGGFITLGILLIVVNCIKAYTAKRIAERKEELA